VFMTAICDKLSLTDKELDVLLETFIEALPEMLKSKLLKCVSCKLKIPRIAK